MVRNYVNVLKNTFSSGAGAENTKYGTPPTSAPQRHLLIILQMKPNLDWVPVLAMKEILHS